MSSLAPLKRINLTFVNAAEDVPRVVRAYGKAGGDEYALVLRPHDATGVLVRSTKGGGTSVWQAGSAGDGPFTPDSPAGPKEAVGMVTSAQKNVPKNSPITLRGQWLGKLDIYADGRVSVELSRKVASYGTLHILSTGDGTWTWKVQRGEKWFSSAREQQGSKARTLSEAISTGLANAMGLLGEACSMRDSRRRSAYDSSYAQAHPIKPAAERKDPTEKFSPKEPKPPKEPKQPKTLKQPKTATEPKAPKEQKAPKQPRGAGGRKKPSEAPSSAPVVPIDPFAAPHGQPAAQPGYPPAQHPTAPQPGAAMAAPGVTAPNPELDQMLMTAMMKQLETLDLSKLA